LSSSEKRKKNFEDAFDKIQACKVPRDRGRKMDKAGGNITLRSKKKGHPTDQKL